MSPLKEAKPGAFFPFEDLPFPWIDSSKNQPRRVCEGKGAGSSPCLAAFGLSFVPKAFLQFPKSQGFATQSRPLLSARPTSRPLFFRPAAPALCSVLPGLDDTQPLGCRAFHQSSETGVFTFPPLSSHSQLHDGQHVLKGVSGDTDYNCPFGEFFSKYH